MEIFFTFLICDYVDVPKVSISGGNGTGAVAECKMVTVPYQVVFNSGSGSQTIVVKGSDDFNVGFLTYHKFYSLIDCRVVYFFQSI